MELVKKIDIHAHIVAQRGMLRPNGATMTTPEELIDIYDQLNVERGVLLPIVSREGNYDGNTNREIFSVVQDHPDRFAWFCGIDPREGMNSPDTDFDRILSYYKSQGAVGVGELIANLSICDPRVDALFAACQRQDMPVIIHIGAAQGDYGLIDELGLPGLERALQKFPELKIICHSQKFWAEISGDLNKTLRSGYPKGPIVPGGRVIELMDRYPNLYADLSANSGFNAITRDPEFGCRFLETYQDRIFYGMDLCAPTQIANPFAQLGAKLDAFALRGAISYEAYLKISRNNALAILNKN